MGASSRSSRRVIARSCAFFVAFFVSFNVFAWWSIHGGASSLPRPTRRGSAGLLVLDDASSAIGGGTSGGTSGAAADDADGGEREWVRAFEERQRREKLAAAAKDDGKEKKEEEEEEKRVEERDGFDGDGDADVDRVRETPTPIDDADADADAAAEPSAAVAAAPPPRSPPSPSSPSPPPPSPTALSSSFAPKLHTEYGGDVVKWGTTHLVENARACHDACDAMRDATPRPCNVWVFCPAAGGCAGGREPRGACWLKHQPRPENPTGPADAPDNPWTSGSMAAPADVRGERGVHKRFHVVVTTNANPYQAWQVRTMHYWYLKQKAKQDPRDGQMGGFTRVLHDQPDGLMDEIPTCVVDRLDDEMGFVVLSRPNAFKQFFEKCPEIEEDYILMAEPDHLYLRPLDNLMNGRTPAAFPFFYIEPAKFPTLVRRFMGDVTITDADLAAMDPIGSSPVFIHKDDLRKIAPTWHDVTVKIKRDPEANKEWGWVLEMYGYTIASWLSGVRHDLRPKLQAQPPWDKSVSDFYILHFTYGNDYDLDGTFTPGKMGKWRFDKRTWTQGAPEKNLTRPPAGMDNELVRFLVDAVNEASASLPHWDDPTGMKRLGGKPAGQGLRRKDTASVSSGRPRAGGRRGGGGGAASASTPRTTTAATG